MGFADDFVGELQGLKFEDAFNPYSDECEKHDQPGAPKIRSRTLKDIIDKAVQSDVEAIWVGLAPGYQGAKRTGLGFTDNATLARHCDWWGVTPTQPTRDSVTEPTASTAWQALDKIRATWQTRGDSSNRIFLWNVFPLHPHDEDRQFSNRAPCPLEVKAGRKLLRELIVELKPQRLIAVGNVAHGVIKKLDTGIEPLKVRHPSYGGKAEFLSQIRKLYP